MSLADLRHCLILALAVITASAAIAARATQSTSSPLAITHVTVIDGTGSPPQPDMTVVIDRDRIARIGRANDLGPPSAARIIDGRGKFLLPGLIDTHAHVTYLDWVGQGTDRRAVYNDDVSRASLRLLLAFGVTTIRNPAGPTRDAVALRSRVAAGELPGPTIFTAGAILNRAPRFDGLTRPVDSRSDVEREIAAQADERVDFVKIYGNMPPALTAAAIEASHRHRLKLIGHLQATSWTAAARLGIDAIAHGASWAIDELPSNKREGYRRATSAEGAMRARMTWLEMVEPDGPEIRTMVRELAERKIPVDPTLIAYATKFLGDDPRFVRSADLARAPAPMRASFPESSFVRDWTTADFERGRRVWPRMNALIRAYHRGGVLLTAGSDEPNSWIVPGPGLHTELELLVEAGLSPLDVLSIATRNGAESLGILQDVGTITAGKRADLVIVDADPIRDIRNTRRISAVIQAGRLVE